jgi:hypothetical protein
MAVLQRLGNEDPAGHCKAILVYFLAISIQLNKKGPAETAGPFTSSTYRYITLKQ